MMLSIDFARPPQHGKWQKSAQNRAEFSVVFGISDDGNLHFKRCKSIDSGFECSKFATLSSNKQRYLSANKKGRIEEYREKRGGQVSA
jgi:hypothetical protein